MVYDSLEDIRRRKLEELKKKLEEKKTEEEKKVEIIRKQIQMMEEITRKFLTGKAQERLNIIKSVHPDRYLQILELLYHNIVSGRLRRKITDDELKKILKQIINLTKRETKIRFIRK